MAFRPITNDPTCGLAPPVAPVITVVFQCFRPQRLPFAVTLEFEPRCCRHAPFIRLQITFWADHMSSHDHANSLTNGEAWLREMCQADGHGKASLSTACTSNHNVRERQCFRPLWM